MTVSGLPSATTPSYLATPAVQMAQLEDTSLATLFGGASGEPSDLTALTSAVVALPLYQQPGLLTSLGGLGGSPAPSSSFTFNPFDQSSWWTDPVGSTVDASA